MAITYKGFSTVGRYKKFRLTDFDLVKQDLLNHFNIRRGEKLMQPNFGTIIWDMIFEPLTEETKAVIIADLQQIVAYDPRIYVTRITVDQLDAGLQLEFDITYVPTDQTQNMYLTFDGHSRTLTTGS
jgi:phage baseplate assembly protein W